MADILAGGGTRGALAAALVVPLLLAGCGSAAETPAAQHPAAQGQKVADPGPFLQMCGGVGDAEFLALAGLPPETKGLRNLVGCTWDDTSSGPMGSRGHGSFSWYRGSPIEREHSIVGITGRDVRAISIGGKDGYEARDHGGALCEVAVGLGDDFFLWSVVQTAVDPDSCAVARELATLTVQRAQ